MAVELFCLFVLAAYLLENPWRWLRDGTPMAGVVVEVDSDSAATIRDPSQRARRDCRAG